MLKTIAFVFLVVSCIYVTGLNRGSRPPKARRERVAKRSRHQADSKYNFQQDGRPALGSSEPSDSQDVLISLLNCKPFGRFMGSLKEAQLDLLPRLKERKLDAYSVPGRRNRALTRRAKLWIGKLQMQVRRIFKSCLPTTSLRTLLKDQLIAIRISKMTQSEIGTDSFEDIGSLSIDDKIKHIFSPINSRYQDTGIATQYTDRKLTRGSKRRNKARHSLGVTSKSRDRRRKVAHLAKDVLRMLSADGEIDVPALFEELVMLIEDRVLPSAQQFNTSPVSDGMTSLSSPGSHVKVAIEGQIRDVPPYFLSVAVGARIIQSQLPKLASSPRFLTLSRGLSPAILRYGGTYAMFVLYDPDGLEDLPSSSPQETLNENPIDEEEEDDDDVGGFPLLSDDPAVDSQAGNGCVFDSEWHSHYRSKPSDDSTYNILAAMVSAGGEGNVNVMQDDPTKFDANSCGCDDCDVLNYVNFTMTADDLVALTDFADDVGMKLLFDVNQLYRNSDFEWDPANARMIFRDAAARNNSLIWQLGNEPNSYFHKFGFDFTGHQDAQDFHIFRQELTDFFHQPAIIGPDVTRPHHRPKRPDTYADSVHFLRDFLSHLEFNLTAISWHQYYVDGRTATADDFLSYEMLDYLAWQIPEIVRTRDELAPDTPIWLTETSSAWGGGAKDLSNRYADGFMWLDKLGMAAVGGIDVVTRQTLYHGCYALVDYVLNPNPSYWLSWVFKALVGERVLNLTAEGASKTTRLYAHCQKSSPTSLPGNVVIFGMNLSNTTIDIEIEGIETPNFIEQYLLEPLDGDLQSGVMLLNGEVLEMPSDEELPELKPVLVPPQIFQIPQTTFGFWVIVDANVKDCY